MKATIRLGQTWSYRSSMSPAAGRVRFVVTGIGPHMVACECEGGRLISVTRKTLEKGLRNARVELDPDGTPVVHETRVEMRGSTQTELRTASDARRTYEPKGCLTPRALKCAELSQQGMAPAAIAERLGMSAKTVHRYLREVRSAEVGE